MSFSADDLTLGEIDEWETATGHNFTEANQAKQLAAAMWAAERRTGSTRTPDEVLKGTTLKQVAGLLNPDADTADPTAAEPEGVSA
jgi:hypothetical protein